MVPQKMSGALSSVTHFDIEIFQRLADQLPCLICVFDCKGTLRYINPAMLKWTGIPQKKTVVDEYNLHDWHAPDFEAFRISKRLQEVLDGNVDYAASVLIPVYEEEGDREKVNNYQYASVCAFPLQRKDGSIHEVGFLFFPHSSERVEEPVMYCRMYIDRFWREPFDMEYLAVECSMSKNHLSKLFKRAFGMTPFQYYRWVKLENVRVNLGEPGQTIAEAFEACGLQYSGFMAKEFKKLFGLSPREYRKTLLLAYGRETMNKL